VRWRWISVSHDGNADHSGSTLPRAIRQDIRDSALTRLKDLAQLDAVDREAEGSTDDAASQRTNDIRRQPTEAEVEAQAAAFIGSENDSDDDNGDSTIKNINTHSERSTGRPLNSGDRPPPPKRIRSDNAQAHLRPDERMTKKGWIKKITPEKLSQGKDMQHKEKCIWEAKPVQALADFRVNIGYLRQVRRIPSTVST
jgi:hypothetical protein